MEIKELFFDLITNSLVVTPLIAWCVAQLAKVFVQMFVEKKFNIRRIFGAGGMPSSHTATTIALTVSSGWYCGLGSPVFAVSCILAIIVMHDAVGVRRETDKQSRTIKQIADIIDDISNDEAEIRTDKLKDFVGHTPMQVVFGAFIGIIVVILYMIIAGVQYGSFTMT